MKYFAIALLLADISVALPTSRKAPRTVNRRSHGYSPYSSHMTRQRAAGSDCYSNATTGESDITDNQELKFLMPVTIGSQTLLLEIDTGSSDTWAIQTGFQCYESANSSIPFSFQGPILEDQCNFGTTFTLDDNFQVIEGVDQFTCYGNGVRCLGGEFGYSPVTLAGLQIPSQQVGAPNLSSFPAVGSTIQSGLIGLAFNALADEFPVDANGSVSAPQTYTSIMTTLFGLTYDPPLERKFAVAISRDSSNNTNGGVITFGGIPDITDAEVNATSTFGSAPWVYDDSLSTNSFSFYSIVIDSFLVGDDATDAGQQVLIDTGADTFEVGMETLTALAAAFDPPGNVTSFPSETTVVVECDATQIAQLGVSIGGVSLYLNPVDVIDFTTSQDGYCGSKATLGNGVFSLGDVLLRNSLAVFDWENKEMSFSSRPYYTS